ncbi:hypothetical protein BD779DRAFT_1541378, partial [Infundibulicybe gibba]
MHRSAVVVCFIRCPSVTGLHTWRAIPSPSLPPPSPPSPPPSPFPTLHPGASSPYTRAFLHNGTPQARRTLGPCGCA